LSPIAIIGGSGFAAMPGLTKLGEELPETPYGPPSGPIVHGRLDGGGEVMFLPRHGAGHSIPPHLVNYRANIWALKHRGVERVVGLAAVGGIGALYAPRALVVPDQLIDYTCARGQTFFDGGAEPVVHIDLTEPYCRPLRSALLQAGRGADIAFVDGGTYGVTQGPRLETAAEVRRLERDGCDMVGMTGMPEAALAREAGLCYACCAFVVNWAAGKSGGEILMSEIEANIAACAGRIAGTLAALTRTDTG
jgi:5'-methylthioadenosine phosphorylase/5'-methylthioinosine phosphorylase